MPAHQRRLAQCVHRHADPQLPLHQGDPKTFSRADLENPVTREFCAECGSHILARSPGFPAVILKVGSLDDPSVFTPGMAIFTVDQQAFHHVPAGIPSFERLPG
uniref:GFA family protein n=1 Tax=Phenylobacterium glaciei TaxID=2803784 RepID=A0A974P0B7_9CAUL|nr:GFA family protein [Phenylobacterium glaciei]